MRSNSNKLVISALLFSAQIGMLITYSSPLLRGQTKKGTSTPPAASPAPSSPGGAFESQMLAFGALEYVASQIADEVCKAPDIKNTSNIVIFDQASFANIQAYTAFKSNARMLIAAYNNIVVPQPPQNPVSAKDLLHKLEPKNHRNAIGTAPSVASTREGAFVNTDLLTQRGDYLLRRMEELSATVSITGDPLSDASGLLQAIASSSNTETANSSTIPDSALAVLITQKLSAKKGDSNCANKTIIYPPLFGHGSITDYATVDIETYLSWVNAARQAAYANLENVFSSKETQDKLGASHAAIEAQLNDINSLYDSFMNSLLQVNSSTGVIGSAAVIQGHQIAMLLSGHKKGESIAADSEHEKTDDPIDDVPPAYVLLATIVSAGGTQRDHKTFWTSLGSGDKITYSGGAIVNVSLWKANSPLPVYNAELRYRTPFMNVKDPAEDTGVDAGDNLKKR